MLSWLSETMHTLRVATLHPLGWGWERLVSGPQGLNLETQESAAQHQSPLLFVHGVLHNATAFFSFERTLRGRGFCNFRSVELLTSLRNVETLAERLKAEALIFLERQKIQSTPPKLRIVGHSLGGIVVRAALCDPAFAERVSQVIFLGTPHQGLRVQLPFPRSLSDVSSKSPLIRKLRHDPLPGGIEYWNLRGQLDLITPFDSTYLPFVPNWIFRGVGHVGLLSNPQVLQTVVEILESPLYSGASHVHPRTASLRFG